MNREEKTQLLAELNELFNNAETIVVSHYKGLTVEEVSELKASAQEEMHKVSVLNECPWYKRVDWGSVAAGIAAIAIPSLVTAVVTHKR